MFPYYQEGLSPALGSKTIRGVNRTIMITPKVVEHEKYFNCENIEGVELKIKEAQVLPFLIGSKEFY